MGILGRLSTMIKSNVNDLIDSMQDPAKEIDQMVRDMEDSAREARSEVATCMAEESNESTSKVISPRMSPNVHTSRQKSVRRSIE